MPQKKKTLISELEAVRMDNDWTYEQVADAIKKATGHRRNPDCWRKLCTGETKSPHSRTLYLLDAFLATVNRRRTA